MSTDGHSERTHRAHAVVLVTRAAGRIGAATAARLAPRSMTVIMSDRADGTEVATELGLPHRFVRQDVSDPESWPAVLQALDRLDVQQPVY
jgi:NAD(P)-dependent dehydrogenase (short-subunit alcohol dehydrogenase family)